LHRVVGEEKPIAKEEFSI